MSVVDTVLEIIDIVDVVEETKEMVDQLNGPIKQSYKDYFNGIRAASQEDGQCGSTDDKDTQEG
ncbi:hypothetical protein FOCG_16087 [Fusarium oxysporum f. sp. radicis-lycopersici 26381]|uniref:Uncharacterized protein n=2 Tax=Fusarium oxysporum TaxID=5507 RepID=X0AZT4_FUSOX|nr:uncharacterized protein FOBCDRAFT_266468 [Fusarium oxysporum Fo47]EWZ86550.1 hypothetical protein FOWG_10112 [Fusarium oxysporum f. sp. lycopersici MN25]EXK49714.1 hypothetical protein FOMG_02200 [Fusarium oxysporum f. sp. melonis 26406]EXL41271.1 hypothetical protein FOCG_16087 [Fusarium oxysporum f. sp. radicis-lycopersici 26381]KAJ4125820.1 hypothetical protein NW765_001594 [Fusarium oxysporum]RKK36343.1 hypothetical protein BFJ67_g12853 [Fusarium oxysporum f. sp. cepae]